MSNKRITEALKDLFLGLGGDASMLSDNQTVSDYIDDLESAIKAEASGIINDNAASEATTYSSLKIASLIPANELPTPVEALNKKIAKVISDGNGGYKWGAIDETGNALGVWFTYDDLTETYSLVTGSGYPTTAEIYQKILADGIVYGRVDGVFPAQTRFTYAGANITGSNAGTVSFMRTYIDANDDTKLEVLTLDLTLGTVKSSTNTITTAQV